MSDDNITVVNFDIRCPARIDGVVTPIDLWSDSPDARDAIEAAGGRYGTGRSGEASERRLRLAEFCLGEDTLQRSKSYARPTRFRLVGQFRFRIRSMSSLEASDSAAALIDWTLRHVYGHESNQRGRHMPVNDVTIRLWQQAAPTNRNPP